MNENENLGAYAIMYVVHNNRNEVISLLLKNGVVVPSNAQDIQIGLLVTNLLKVSSSFYDDFVPLILNEETISGMSSNMSGSYSNVNGNDSYCANTSNKTESPNSYKILCKDYKPSTSTDSTPKSTPSWLNKGLDILQTGFQGYLQLDDNKTKRALADASVKVSGDTVKNNELVPPPSKKLSTGAIIGISLLGVTVVGLVVYLIAKKR